MPRGSLPAVSDRTLVESPCGRPRGARPITRPVLTAPVDRHGGMRAMSRFLERLATGPPLVGDGGMGTLVSSAVARLRCPEEANIRSPESVLSLHLGFIRAGADIIETNTFGANRRKLAEHYLEEDVARDQRVRGEDRTRRARGVRRGMCSSPARSGRSAARRRIATRSSPSRPSCSRAAASTSS